MEVLLKKSKITSTIFNQIGIASISQLITYDILGFCINKGYRWIVLYYNETNDLKKFRLIKKVETKASGLDQLVCEIEFYGDSPTGTYRLDNNFNQETWLDKLLAVRDTALSKGQFYL